MKDYHKNKESSYLMYWNGNNLYRWTMLYKLPADNFECVENTSEFNENFQKDCNEDNDSGYFLELDAEYPINLYETLNDVPFSPERMKI